MSEVTEFYDNFSTRQALTGINNRHVSILHQLENAGLKKTDNILEVGCGIGTVSELILRTLSSKGSLYGVDISPQSIELANRLTLKYSNAFFEVRDLTTDVINRKFDVIVLPDVIEHIPFDLYPSLFSNLNKMMSDNAYIFIHIPHPNYLEWLIHCGSYDLQIIDQPVYTNKLLSIVYPIGFYIHYLSSYSVYSENCDYQVIILKIKSISKRYELKSVPFQLGWYTKLRKRIRYLVRGFK